MQPPEATVYVGLGANLGDPPEQLRGAMDALGRLPATRLEAASRLFLTAPVGPPGQPDYVNAVVRLATGLAPLALLDALQGIETAHGRTRGERWGARTLDLDILLFGNMKVALERLRLPHPQLAHRAFVLVPLAEVAPADLALPGLGPLAALVAACDRSGIRTIV